MKNKYILFLLLALALLATNPAQAAKSAGYWYDTSSNIVRSGVGECVRSIEWSPSNALPECEGKTTKKIGKAKIKKKVGKAEIEKKIIVTKVESDSDKDGVIDSKDRCKDTAVGVKVNADGCALVAKTSTEKGLEKSTKKSAKSIGYWYDISGSVVHSGVGECVRSIAWSPSNALPECEGKITKTIAKAEIKKKVEKIKVEKKAKTIKIAKVEIDSDKDGVIDNKDKCKGTVAGVKVDAVGCDLNKDSDNDGIADASDNCMGTAAGTIVDTHGCKLETDISLAYVQFEFNIAKLNSNSQLVLDSIARTLQANKHLRFEVAGYTDTSGDKQYNINLSVSRADSVRQYLIKKGVAADRLTSHGYGPNKPIATNQTREGRIENRRVELAQQKPK